MNKGEAYIGQWVTRNDIDNQYNIVPGTPFQIESIENNQIWVKFKGRPHDPHHIQWVRPLTKEEILNLKQIKNQQVMTNKARFTIGCTTSKALREGIIMELKERGFKPHSAKTDSEFINNASYCLTQMSDSNAKEYQVEEKGSNPANQTNPKDRHYELPAQWTEAFEAWEEYCKAPAKKKSEVFSIEYDNSEDYLYFNITQGDAIQVYIDEDDATNNEKEDCENGEYLGEITKSQLEGVIAANKIKLGTWNSFNITVSTISIGCKANMAVEDFQTLLDIYNRINS